MTALEILDEKSLSFESIKEDICDGVYPLIFPSYKLIIFRI